MTRSSGSRPRQSSTDDDSNPPQPKIFDLDELCDRIYQESHQRKKEVSMIVYNVSPG